MTARHLMIARRKQLMAEGAPRSLGELFDRTGISVAQCRHMAIDVQKRFVRSEPLFDIADRIVKTIAPEFNRLGVPSYWVYWPYRSKNLPANLRILEEMGSADPVEELYEANLSAHDRALPKNDMSALTAFDKIDRLNSLTLTHQALRRDRARAIFLSGFFYNQCIRETAIDACDKGYHVVLMMDATDGVELDRFQYESRMATGIHLRWDQSTEYRSFSFREEVRRELTEKGVLFVKSEEAFEFLESRKPDRGMKI